MSFEGSVDDDDGDYSDSETSAEFILHGSIIIRNRASVDSVWWQSTMLLTGVLAILSILYILLMMLIVTIHHHKKDAHIFVIPEFISNAYQFSSDEESMDEEEIEILARYEVYIQKGLYKDGRILLPDKGKPKIPGMPGATS